MTLTVNPSSNAPAYSPRFRERNALSIEAPRQGKQHNRPLLTPHMAMDRLAQLNYFAQSIAQAMPAARRDPGHRSNYAPQRPGLSIRV